MQGYVGEDRLIIARIAGVTLQAPPDPKRFGPPKRPFGSFATRGAVVVLLHSGVVTFALFAFRNCPVSRLRLLADWFRQTGCAGLGDGGGSDTAYGLAAEADPAVSEASAPRR